LEGTLAAVGPDVNASRATRARCSRRFSDLKPGAMFGEISAILLSEPTVAVATLRHVTAEVRRLSERALELI
jgi:hypothetical protein